MFSHLGLVLAKRLRPAQMILILLVLLCIALMPVFAWAQDLKIIPAEKFIQTPGGVDMRTGRYMYSHTDLTVGEGENAFSFERIMPDYGAGHANPFGNFSHNFDIWIVESRVDLSKGGTAAGLDFRMNVHIGGRSITFDASSHSTSYGYQGSGPLAYLTFSGDKVGGSTVYTMRDADGTLMTFRPIGSGDCAARRCAFISSLVRPDGTRLDFSYVSSGQPGGNGARLVRVESSRGFTLILEGSGSLVTKSCIVDRRFVAPPAVNTCPAGVPTANYTYGSPNPPRLATMTDPAGQQWGFTYSGSAAPFTMGFVNPGQGSPWLTNTVFLQKDEEEFDQEIVSGQSFADGRSYTYEYDGTPVTEARGYASIIGGQYTDNTGATTIIAFDFPVLPGSRQSDNCPPYPCAPVPPNEFLYVVYQTTPGPVQVVDPLGNTTHFNYCDPAVAAGLPPQYQDRCAVIPLVDSTDPEGIKSFFKYDFSGNVTEVRQRAKPGSGLDDIVRSATYNCSDPASCTKPVTSTDALGNVVNRIYAVGFGGIVSEMQPAPTAGAARPLKLWAYAQRYGWYRNSAGALVQSGAPMWVIAIETQCQTLAGASPGPTCDPSSQQVVTNYEYGAEGTGEALLVKGMAVTANGQTLRTCYSYDQLGRKVSETQPNAALTSCP